MQKFALYWWLLSRSGRHVALPDVSLHHDEQLSPSRLSQSAALVVHISRYQYVGC